MNMLVAKQCPKCGLGRLQGPAYRGPSFSNAGNGSLVYRCDQCGYVHETPTDDHGVLKTMLALAVLITMLTACNTSEVVSCPDVAANYYGICVTSDTFSEDEYAYDFCVTTTRQACPEIYNEWLECLASIEGRADCDRCFGSQWSCDSGASRVALYLCEYRVACLGEDYDVDSCMVDVEVWGDEAAYLCLDLSPADMGGQWEQADCDEVAVCLGAL